MQPDQIARYEYTGILSKTPDWPEPWVYLLFAVVVLVIGFYSGYKAGSTNPDIDKVEKEMDKEDGD